MSTHVGRPTASMRALAVTALLAVTAAAQQAAAYPPGYEVQTWWGILAPAGSPASVATKLHSEITAIIKQPDSAQRLEPEGAEARPLSSTQFGRLIIAELDKWPRVAREANIRAE
jgi:tripartite-type tricarboxylate transporter receptor subunit TctC